MDAKGMKIFEAIPEYFEQGTTPQYRELVAIDIDPEIDLDRALGCVLSVGGAWIAIDGQRIGAMIHPRRAEYFRDWISDELAALVRERRETAWKLFLKGNLATRPIDKELGKAAAFGMPTSLAAVIAAGADSSRLNRDGQTPLFMAAKAGHRACVELLIPVSDVNAKNKFGQTALMIAVLKGNSCCEALIEASDIHIRDEDGTSPWSIFNGARANSYYRERSPEIVAMLERKEISGSAKAKGQTRARSGARL